MRQKIWWAATLALGFGIVLSLGSVGLAGDAGSRQPAALGVTLSQFEGGVSVSTVISGSPAALAGLRVGDEIRSVDEQPIHTAQELAAEIGDRTPGATVDLLIRRNGERQIVKATLAADESVFGKRNAQPRGSAYSYQSVSGQGIEKPLAQQVNALNQQISRLQRQLDEMRSRQDDRVSTQRNMQSQDWGWNGHGTHNDDPALFQ